MILGWAKSLIFDADGTCMKYK